HDDRKSQLPRSGEILRAHSVASDELRIVQLVAQQFDKCREIGGNAFQNGSHPHFAYTVYLQCTSKNEIIFISTLNSTTVLPSPLPARSSRGEGVTHSWQWWCPR